MLLCFGQNYSTWPRLIFDGLLINSNNVNAADPNSGIGFLIKFDFPTLDFLNLALKRYMSDKTILRLFKLINFC